MKSIEIISLVALVLGLIKTSFELYLTVRQARTNNKLKEAGGPTPEDELTLTIKKSRLRNSFFVLLVFAAFVGSNFIQQGKINELIDEYEWELIEDSETFFDLDYEYKWVARRSDVGVPFDEVYFASRVREKLLTTWERDGAKWDVTYDNKKNVTQIDANGNTMNTKPPIRLYRRKSPDQK